MKIKYQDRLDELLELLVPSDKMIENGASIKKWKCFKNGYTAGWESLSAIIGTCSTCAHHNTSFCPDMNGCFGPDDFCSKYSPSG